MILDCFFHLVSHQEAQKEFIRLFGKILQRRNILNVFDEFEGKGILSERELQDFQSMYIDLYQDYRKNGAADREDINDDIIFEIELVKQIDINIDYILMLVAKYHRSNCSDKEVLVAIDSAVNSSIELRRKKELIQKFIEQVNVSTQVVDDWSTFVDEQYERDLSEIISTEHLKLAETHRFMKECFQNGMVKNTGTGIDKILPPLALFANGNNKILKKQVVIERLSAFFGKYSGLHNS